MCESASISGSSYRRASRPRRGSSHWRLDRRRPVVDAIPSFTLSAPAGHRKRHVASRWSFWFFPLTSGLLSTQCRVSLRAPCSSFTLNHRRVGIPPGYASDPLVPGRTLSSSSADPRGGWVFLRVTPPIHLCPGEPRVRLRRIPAPRMLGSSRRGNRVRCIVMTGYL